MCNRVVGNAMQNKAKFYVLRTIKTYVRKYLYFDISKMCKDTASVLIFVNNILQNMMTRGLSLTSTKDVIFQKYFDM